MKGPAKRQSNAVAVRFARRTDNPVRRLAEHGKSYSWRTDRIVHPTDYLISAIKPNYTHYERWLVRCSSSVVSCIFPLTANERTTDNELLQKNRRDRINSAAA